MIEARLAKVADDFRLPQEVRDALMRAVREERRAAGAAADEEVAVIHRSAPGVSIPSVPPGAVSPGRAAPVDGRVSRAPEAPRVSRTPPEAPRKGPGPRQKAPEPPPRPVAVAPPQPELDPLEEATVFTAVVLPDAPVQQPRDPVDRYEDLGVIGTGATSEVRRVRDTDLNRLMAMKIIHAHLQRSSGTVARFVSEAQATAQLEHPGIIPVHAIGQLPDGRYYFTMKEVRGQTLGAVIGEVHKASAAGGRWKSASSGWTFRRLIEALRKVCEAVGYAHARGVVHRDLKPENIMVGPFGEVLVMDWGLAKVLGSQEPAHAEDPVATWRSQDDAYTTRIGSIAGTPTYMPPEQARGAHDEVGPPSDVYALGAILYEILAGHPPYQGKDAIHVLAQVLEGPPPPPGRVEVPGLPNSMAEGEAPAVGPPPIPEALQQICMKALNRESADRFPEAGAMATEIESWLDGAKRREQARAELERARELWDEIQALRQQAEETRVEAAEMLKAVRPWEPAERKRPAWSLEDRAVRLAGRADLKEVVMTQVLQAALTFVPEHTEAHDILADHYQTLHAEAEARRDRAAVTRYEALLQAHDTGRHSAYLRGDGALTLITDPPDAEVELFRVASFDRRLRTVPMRSLGRTPLYNVELQRGSYLLKIRAPGRVEVRYPVNIGRGEHWDGVRPGSTSPHPIYLPLPQDLGNNGLYVPAGWTWIGGDPDAVDASKRQRVWVDGFAIQRFPVTNWEFIAFLDAHVKGQRERVALRFAPRERSGTVGRLGALIYGRDSEGRFILRQDADGDRWEPTWPVLMVDWPGAHAYGRWYGNKARQPWRLPSSLEWEKAARGVDGRYYPWGDYLDPTWAVVADSHEHRPTVFPVDAFPVDESPYGVRGLAGNASDWCADAYRDSGPELVNHCAVAPPVGEKNPDLSKPRVVKGGCWSANATLARAASVTWHETDRRGSDVGFRLARPLNSAEDTRG